MDPHYPRRYNDYTNLTLCVKQRAHVLDCYGAGDVARALGPLRIVDPAADAVAPQSACVARCRGLVDGLIELPSACWPLSRRAS